MVATAFGFLAFYVIEKLTAVHVGHEAAAELDHGDAAHRHVGVIGASGMSIHSFLDGVALAAGLAVGGGLGLVIAVVVVDPSVQRRDLRRQPVAGQPYPASARHTDGSRSSRSRPSSASCSAWS